MSFSPDRRVHVIDSHTGGEPTRVVLTGGPDLNNGSMESRLQILKNEYDYFRSALVSEPRGTSSLVGVIVFESLNPENNMGAIFFNSVGYLGMCGHGTIGLITTLSYLNKIQVGKYKIETPVGIVEAELESSGAVSVTNVPSFRRAKNVTLNVHGIGEVVGDIAWGGNWFFLIDTHPFNIQVNEIEKLTEYATLVRKTLQENNITGDNGHEIDHIELFVPSEKKGIDSRNFVLCPGKSYDRSPCGTGTSAKMACMYADGKLKEGQIYKQESIIGSIFEGSIFVKDGKIIPKIKGTAFVNSESYIILNEHDPFCWGIPL